MKEIQQSNKNIGLTRREFIKGAILTVSGGGLGAASLVNFCARLEATNTESMEKLKQVYPDVTPVRKTLCGGSGPAVACGDQIVGFEIKDASKEKNMEINNTYKRFRNESKTPEDKLKDKLEIAGMAIGTTFGAWGILEFFSGIKPREEE